MKKSTILLASLTAAGPLAAFIFPASLMLLCSTDASVPVNATPQTFDLPPFRHLVIERNDTADIYLPLDFNIEASDSTDTPTLTTAQDWGKWLTYDYHCALCPGRLQLSLLPDKRPVAHPETADIGIGNQPPLLRQDAHFRHQHAGTLAT